MHTAMRLPDWLRRRADVSPTTVAIETPGQRLTYKELYDIASGMAGVLTENGVRVEHRVAILAKSGLYYSLGLHAVMQCDGAVVPLNTRLTPQEMAWQLEDAGVAVMLYDDAEREVAAELVRLMDGTLRVVALEDMVQSLLAAPHHRPVQRTHILLDRVQAVIYTSGTTGRPKGTLITYGNHWWSATASAIQLGLSTQERWLVPMPLFHVGGLSVLMRSLIYGTTAVVHDRFDPNAVNQAIDVDKVTLVSVVPVMLRRMLADRNVGYPATLRTVLLGGSAATKSLLEQCQALSVPVAQSYGLTETNTQAATLRPEDGLRKLGSSGKPLFPTEVAIWVDNQPAPPNVAGEIVVRGPTVTKGYLNRPDATSAAFTGDWLHTGDIGMLDEEGYLYVLDRRNDLIVSGGENVYPAEVESVLSAHPSVVEAAVVGAEHPEWGQVPVAFVVAAEQRERAAEELIAHCRDRIAGYKVPAEIYFLDRLPRNASGKLLRRSLREWLSTKH